MGGFISLPGWIRVNLQEEHTEAIASIDATHCAAVRSMKEVPPWSAIFFPPPDQKFDRPLLPFLWYPIDRGVPVPSNHHYWKPIDYYSMRVMAGLKLLAPSRYDQLKASIQSAIECLAEEQKKHFIQLTERGESPLSDPGMMVWEQVRMILNEKIPTY
jgi:hypothetical protein